MTGSCLSLIQSQAKSFEAIARTARMKRIWQATKHKITAFFSTSTMLASLYGGFLCFSMLPYFSKARIFHVAIENSQLLQYGHAYQLNDRTNVKTMDACVHVLYKGAKMKTVTPQNDRPTERNINFLLTATVYTCTVHV